MTPGPNAFHLAGKRILITGSSSGLGFEIARGLARAGAAVILNGRRPEKLATAVQQLKDDGACATSVCFDVTFEDEVRRGIADVGAVDVLVNNAGIQRRGPLEQFSLADWNE